MKKAATNCFRSGRYIHEEGPSSVIIIPETVIYNDDIISGDLLQLFVPPSTAMTRQPVVVKVKLLLDVVVEMLDKMWSSSFLLVKGWWLMEKERTCK